MTRTVAIVIFASLTLSVFFGAAVITVECSKSPLHVVGGMFDCPKMIAALLHHMDAFLLAFTAVVLAIAIFFAPRHLTVMSFRMPSPPLVAMESYEREHRDAIAQALPHQFFSRGILHRKDAPAYIF